MLKCRQGGHIFCIYGFILINLRRAIDMRHMMIIAGVSLLLASCTKTITSGDISLKIQSDLAATTYLDVSYGSDPKQVMDIYLPANRTSSTRVLIIIHGGGWTSGDKSDFTSYVTEFQKRLPGYAVANLDYRLATTNKNHFPAQENDVKSAITYLKNKSADYSISNDYVLLGVSAGAHLAMLQGYKHSDVLQPKGIISFFGPVDLQALYEYADASIPWVLKTITGQTLEENPDLFAQSSPINYVNQASAPTLILQGDNDKLVPVEQAFMLH
ncbi:MAG: alpha/beta hydrolase, partial [Flavitalea sp.]